MLLLVLSDFHLGKGKFLKNGQLNILEDFTEDDRFFEFADYYSSGKYHKEEVHLVLNGDILNLIQIDVDGVFSHIVDEDISVRAIDAVYEGHQVFFKGLRKFLESPNKKITYVFGNHDAGMAFESAQKHFQEIVGHDISFCYELIVAGIHIEHGHRFEAINAVTPKNFFLKGPNGKKILNLPWGSLFCVSVLPQLKKERPYIDKIRPMSAYVKWTIVHDFPFFLKMFVIVLKYFIRTRFDDYTKQNRNFKTTLKMLQQWTIYPKYEKKAKKMLMRRKDLHTIIMGHTHLHEWRRFPEGKYYFNTGTWNIIPSTDSSLYENITSLTYFAIDLNNDNQVVKKGSLNVWQGNWRPFREETSFS